MDGNRRWAKANNFKSIIGHEKGLSTAEEICIYSNEIGIKYLTLYAFSVQNWSRSRMEIDSLFVLFSEFFNTRGDFFIKYGTKIVINRTEIGEYILLTINAADKTQAYELLKVAKTKGEQWAMEQSLKVAQIAKNKAIQELLGYLKYSKEKYGKMDKETIYNSILLYCALK